MGSAMQEVFQERRVFAKVYGVDKTELQRAEAGSRACLERSSQFARAPRRRLPQNLRRPGKLAFATRVVRFGVIGGIFRILRRALPDALLRGCECRERVPRTELNAKREDASNVESCPSSQKAPGKGGAPGKRDEEDFNHRGTQGAADR